MASTCLCGLVTDRLCSDNMSEQTRSSLRDNCGDFLIGDISCIRNTYRMWRRHHWSNASRRRLEVVFILHVSAP